MPARIVLVAEAVAAAINTASLPIPVQAQMKWMPLTAREDMSVIACWAIPSTETPSALGRQRGQYDCEILVALQKEAEDEPEISALAENLEAIGTALFQKSLPPAPPENSERPSSTSQSSGASRTRIVSDVVAGE